MHELEKENNLISSFIVSLSIAGISTMVFLLCLTISVIVVRQTNSNIFTSLSFVISFVVIPRILMEWIDNEVILSFPKNRIKLIVNSLMIITAFIVMTYFFHEINIIILMFFVALGEEYLFREIIYEFLKKRNGVLIAIVFNSIIFAFYLHINGELADNLLIRLPIGVVLSLLKYKFGLTKAILGHWIYNILIMFL